MRKGLRWYSEGSPVLSRPWGMLCSQNLHPWRIRFRTSNSMRRRGRSPIAKSVESGTCPLSPTSKTSFSDTAPSSLLDHTVSSLEPEASIVPSLLELEIEASIAIGAKG